MRKFSIKLKKYLLVPFSIIVLELIFFHNHHSGILIKSSKLFNSYKTYDICFYGDSKNQWNFNLNVLKEKFPKISFYNFSFGGASFDDLIFFYDKNLCSCNLNIINHHELIDDQLNKNNLTKFQKLSFIMSNLFSFNYLNPLNLYSGIVGVKKRFNNNATSTNGFYNILNRGYLSTGRFDFGPDKIKKEIDFKYRRLSKKIKNKNVLFIIHANRKFRENYLKKNFGEDFLINLHQKYFSENQLIDFRELEILKSDDLYYDTTHLNNEGTIVFTTFFSDSLKVSKHFKKIFNKNFR